MRYHIERITHPDGFVVGVNISMVEEDVIHYLGRGLRIFTKYGEIYPSDLGLDGVEKG